MTGDEITMLEARRARWHRARSPLKLVDTTTDEFACGGLAAYAEPPDMRIVVLPANPCQAHVRLNSEAAEWFHQERPRPFDGLTMQWGHERRATSQALVVGTRFGNDANWRQYVALHRHGGAEFATADVSWPINDRGVRAFSLVHITAFAWTLLDLQHAAAERWGIEGPWEVTLALRECGGAYLGGFAEGWVSPGEFRYGQLRASSGTPSTGGKPTRSSPRLSQWTLLTEPRIPSGPHTGGTSPTEASTRADSIHEQPDSRARPTPRTAPVDTVRYDMPFGRERPNPCNVVRC